MSPFGDWMAANGLSDPKAEATPGMTNMMAFALGADLLANPQDALPVSSFVQSGEETHFTLSVRRRTEATELSFIVETSDDLGTWRSGPADVEIVGLPVDNGDGDETIDFRVHPDVDTYTSCFVRSQWDECRVAGYHGTA